MLNKSIGLHFGHDASICILEANNITFLSQERRTRIKHAIGLNSDEIISLIQSHKFEKIDISSTQHLPIFYDHSKLIFELEDSESIDSDIFFKNLDKNHHYNNFNKWHPSDLSNYRGIIVAENKFFIKKQEEDSKTQYSLPGFSFNKIFSFYPKKKGKLILRDTNKSIKVNYWQHHYLHAVYAASMCNFQPTLIVTGDGGLGPSYEGGGIFFFSKGSGLKAIVPTDGWIGYFYDYISEKIGLGNAGGAGKLMGLAAYGKPHYYEKELIGTKTWVSRYHQSISQMADLWLKKIGFKEGEKYWCSDDDPPQFLADIAASVQLIFEENQLRIIDTAIQIAAKENLLFEHLSLSGGTALNCPSNTRIYKKYPSLSIGPAINDEGLSIACSIMGWKESTKNWPSINFSNPYLGYSIVEELMDLEAEKKGYKIIANDYIDQAVNALLNGELVAVVEGASEIGPRALGHRSLIACPTLKSMWKKVNAAKEREMWRPLAPATLLESLDHYFTQGPSNSQYMLFNYIVNVKNLEAITHVDKTARVQTVNDSSQLFSKLLKKIQGIGAPPVILNTSLNGKWEPIAETEEDIFNVCERLNIKIILTPFKIYIK